MPFYLERLDVRDGGRVTLPEGTASIGRSPKNTIVLSAGERCVSAIHAVVYADPRRLLLQDMQSTNGTYVNGRQVHECVLEAGDEVRLGRSGPRFRVIGADGVGGDAGVGADAGDGIGNNAGARGGADIDGGGVDADVDCDVDDDAGGYVDGDADEGAFSPVAGGGKRGVGVIVAVAAALIVGILIIALLPKSTKPPAGNRDFFSTPETESPAPPPVSVDPDGGGEAAPPQSASPGTATTVERINAVLTRFGETDYRAPPEMVERVEYYIARNTGARRRSFAATLARGRQFFPMIRRVFHEKNVPLELAYVSMQESGFSETAVSHAGAVGLWQFMPHTARRYGLEVSNRVDERTDPEKSTYAAAAYFRHLIAIFGGKSSVMLSMAAYNAGEQRIINALKRIDDPMRDRDFWYLYRMGWLAEETNEYIPQIIALIIISDNLEEYGFNE